MTVPDDKVAVRRGKPESFGWVRKPEDDDKQGGLAYERPDGVVVVLPAGVVEISLPGGYKPEGYDLPPPDDEYVRRVCRIGQGYACCRYLVAGVRPAGWSCEKHGSLRAVLDQRAASRTIGALGDNCDGRGSRR